MMRAYLTSLFVVLLLFVPALVSADLVPCGDTLDDPCTVADFFGPKGTIALVTNYGFTIIASLAALSFGVAGYKYVFSATNPSERQQASDIMQTAVLGLIIAFGAWVFVNLIVNWVSGGSFITNTLNRF